MGFCLFSNVAIAARVAVDEHGLDRVLIVDWDVHHGNGTQDIFYADGRVGFFSIHRWPFYPGTGAADETGTGDGPGHDASICRSRSARRATTYLSEFRDELEEICRADQAAACSRQARLRRPPRRPDRLARIGNRGLRRADEDRARRGRPSSRRPHRQRARRRLQPAGAWPSASRCILQGLIWTLPGR